ncbi:hypothetical protein PCASD_23300 [Puccinia coronata f. sp. avenae]|uniref:Uncharacterized protein n=1 Tax=Puccinia coronata f. sp. avenae TaxID=200324 RepID=A0A2N5TSK3_9BASI|nr:hypothetical protein PCASD_23300 [Puccinia coronata f. sp. avenae]
MAKGELYYGCWVTISTHQAHVRRRNYRHYPVADRFYPPTGLVSVDSSTDTSL